MQPRSARGEEGFDEDLKKALAMSLEEVKGHAGSGYVPQAKIKPKISSQPNGDSKNGVKHGEEEDDDLKAAIAASLADMEEQKAKHTATIKDQTRDGSNSSGPVIMPKNDYELTPVEAENINLFSTLVDRLQTQPPGTILREPQIQELYGSIGKLRPKLARTYGETVSKHGEPNSTFDDCILLSSLDALLDLHAKLSTVVRYYDRMLEERLSNTYNQHNLSGYNLPPQRLTPSMYPSIAAQGPNQAVSAENYYTNPQQDLYARPQSTYSYPTPQPTQEQYNQYDQRASMITAGYPGPESRPDLNQYPSQPQQLSQQPATNWNTPDVPVTPYGAQPQAYTADASQQSQQYQHSTNVPSQPPNNYFPSEPPNAISPEAQVPVQYSSTPSAPPQTSPQQHTSTHHQAPNQYTQAQDFSSTAPSTVSPMQSARQPQPQSQPQPQTYAPQYTALPPQQEVAPPVQQAQHAPPVSQQQPQPQTQNPYWQSQQQQQPPQTATQAWQNPNSTYGGYTQDSFPTAPQHTLQPKVEEALIEL